MPILKLLDSFLTLLGRVTLRFFRSVKKFLSLFKVFIFRVVSLSFLDRFILYKITNSFYRSLSSNLLSFLVMSFLVGVGIIGVLGEMIYRFVGLNLFVTVLATGTVTDLSLAFTALFVLVRIFTTSLINIVNSISSGELRTLQALDIDPINYYVLPQFYSITAIIYVYSIICMLLSHFVGLLYFSLVTNVTFILVSTQLFAKITAWQLMKFLFMPILFSSTMTIFAYFSLFDITKRNFASKGERVSQLLMYVFIAYLLVLVVGIML